MLLRWVICGACWDDNTNLFSAPNRSAGRTPSHEHAQENSDTSHSLYPGGILCVICWVNNANLVSDPRRHAGPGTFRGEAEESAANYPDPGQQGWDSQEAEEEEDEAAGSASSWILL